MKRIAILSLLALCTLLPGAGYAQGTNLTDPEAVSRLFAPVDIPDDGGQWFCGLNVPEEECGVDIQPETSYGCYVYTNGDYTLMPWNCSTGNPACVQERLDNEQTCVRGCRTKCGSSSNSNPCFENCGDACHDSFCTNMKSRCGITPPGCG